jgi:hypothetical protein
MIDPITVWDTTMLLVAAPLAVAAVITFWSYY